MRLANRATKLLFLALVAFSTSVVIGFSAEISAGAYRWVDENGAIHFGDTPPPGVTASEVELSNKVKTSSPLENSSTVSDTAPKVVMYSATWCTICDRAKKWFGDNGIAYREYDIEKSEKGRRDYKKYKGRGVPLIMIGDNRLNGFTPNAFLRIFQSDS